LDGFKVRASHRENVCSLIDQRGRQRLTTKTTDVTAFLHAHLHGIKTRRLATNGVHTSRGNLNIFAISN
jgi:hypothetical protein